MLPKRIFLYTAVINFVGSKKNNVQTSFKGRKISIRKESTIEKRSKKTSQE